MSSQKRTRSPFSLVLVGVVIGLVFGAWAGVTLMPSRSVPAVAPGCDCDSLKQRLSAAESKVIGLQNQLDKAETQAETQVVKLQSVREQLAEAQDHLDRLAELSNQAALGLGRVIMDDLVQGNVDAIKPLSLGEDTELYIQFPDFEAGGFSSETPELWNQLSEWLNDRPTMGTYYFLEGYGDFRNVVFELQDGFLWFQFSDEWALVKIRASLEDPRGSEI